MNERIRELSKDADLDWHKHWNDDETNRLEKFAELIVRECVSICKEKERPNLYGVREVETTIKEHFGVEL
jgi:hypothetical protein